MGNKHTKISRGRQLVVNNSRKSLRRLNHKCENDENDPALTYLSPERIVRTSPHSPRNTELHVDWTKVLCDDNELNQVLIGYQDGLRKRKVAVKFFPDVLKDKELKKRAENEFDIATEIECDYLVKYMELRLLDNNYFITMELCKCDLNSFLVRRVDPFNEAEVLVLAQHLLKAIFCLHNAGILHLDVKPSNILVTGDISEVGENTIFKLGDFGTAKRVKELKTNCSFGGTPDFLAPELLCFNCMKPTEKFDIWAMGMCLYAAATLAMPVEAQIDSSGNITNLNELQDDVMHIPMEPLSALSDGAFNYISYCLRVNPVNRPKATWLSVHQQWIHGKPLVDPDEISD